MKRMVKDARLHKRPKVVRTPQGLELNALFLTPGRFGFVQHVLVFPMSVLWRCAMFVMLIDAILTTAKIWTVFASLPFERMPVWLALLATWLFWTFETVAQYPLLTAVFGRRLKIVLGPEHLTIGRWLFKKRYPLDHELTFAVRSFELATEPAYRHSRQFVLLVDQTLAVPVAEVFGCDVASKLATNANMLFQLADLARETDLDPSRAGTSVGHLSST